MCSSKISMVLITKLYFLLMLHVKQGLARAQLYVIVILDLRIKEKHLLRSDDCWSREKKGEYRTRGSDSKLLLKSKHKSFPLIFN